MQKIIVQKAYRMVKQAKKSSRGLARIRNPINKPGKAKQISKNTKDAVE